MGSVRAEERRHLSHLSKTSEKLLTKLFDDRPFGWAEPQRERPRPKRGSKRVQSARGYTQR